MMGPLSYRRRCNALLDRGLSAGITTALLLAGDVAILLQMESLGDEQLAHMRWSRAQ